jgi:two-component system, chemotaxis family, protein-glutamate methylesterase/glutaminase
VPGHAWIAPGNFHMALERDGSVVRIVTHRDPPENSCRPAADVLFRSAADVYGPHVLAVVMTGMGQDGLHGSERVHAAGGQVLAQDESSSVVWGMPGVVARAGIAHQVLPLGALGPEIMSRVNRRRKISLTTP